MKKTRIGVIGVGYLGYFHAQKYVRMQDVELAGIADIDAARARVVAAELKCPAYADHRELFGKVDAVSVVVPTSAHYGISRDFLQRDVDVLIEKPMAENLEEADELIGLSEARGLILQVGHLERYNPAVVALRDILTNPMFIESHRLGLFTGRSLDVSVVLDLMIHDIDIILNCVKSDLDHLHAAGVAVISPQVDIANARLEFQNGCVANVTASRISAKNQRKIRFFQSDAYVSVDFSALEISITRRDPEADGGPVPGLSFSQIHFEPADALEAELKAFVRSVASRAVPAVSGREGRKALNIALSIMEQINSANRRCLRR